MKETAVLMIVILISILKVNVGFSAPLIPASKADVKNNSPFGILQAYESAQVLANKPKPEVFNYLDGLVKDLGISWVRWGANPHKSILADNDLKSKLRSDGINVSVDLSVRDLSETDINKKVPSLIKNSKNTVKYWQIGNEENLHESFVPPAEFVNKMKLLYGVVKSADPDATVLIGGLGVVIKKEGSNEFEYLREVMKLGGGNYFDVLDFHFFGNAGDYYKAKGKFIGFKSILKEFGFDKPVWVTETSTSSGSPKDGTPQSEQRQARELIKRYVYLLSLGVERVFWTSIVEWKGWGERNKFLIGAGNSFFDHVGLIYDGVGKEESEKGIKFGTKKLAYYTYKKMVETLDGSDWTNIQNIQEKDGIYIYKFIRNNRPIWVAWNENEKAKQISVSNIEFKQVKITEAVPNFETGAELNKNDYPDSFKTAGEKVENGSVIITINENPVFVEGK